MGLSDAFFPHMPETILFAIDLHAEMGSQGPLMSGGRGPTSRLDLVKHAVATLAQSKKQLCADHQFGLLALHQTHAVLLPNSITSNLEQFTMQLNALQPLAAADTTPVPTSLAADSAAAAGSSSGSGSSSSHGGGAFDLGSLITAVQPFAKQQKLQQGKRLHIAGGVLSTPSTAKTTHPSNNSSSSYSNSSSSSSNNRSRSNLHVILIYGRSLEPVPAVLTHSQEGLALDCLYLHDKHQPGTNQVQEVYSALEDAVDGLSLRARHSARIYEASSSRANKVLSSLAMMLAHPLQRLPQVEARPPLDLASAPLQLLPSDAANLASGVPIMTSVRQSPAPGHLSYSSAAAAAAAAPRLTDASAAAAAGPSAWSKPLQAGTWGPAASGAWGSSSAGAGAAGAGAAGAGSSWTTGAGPSSGERPAADYQDPWGDDVGAAGSSNAAAAGASGMVVLGKAPAAGTRSNSSPPPAARSPTSVAVAAAAPGAIVTGVPVSVVTGAPGASTDGCAQPLEPLGEGTVLGYAVPCSSSGGASSFAAGSTAAAAADDDMLDIEGIDEDLDADELSDLAAAIQLSLAGDSAAAKPTAVASPWDD